MKRKRKRVHRKLGSVRIHARPRDQSAIDRLAALGPAINRRVVVPALKSAVESLCAHAKSRVPVDTGTARDALGWSIVVSPRGVTSARIEYDARPIRRNSGNNTFYAAIIEYGTETRPAAAPLRKAVDLDWPAIRARFRTQITAGIGSYRE